MRGHKIVRSSEYIRCATALFLPAPGWPACIVSSTFVAETRHALSSTNHFILMSAPYPSPSWQGPSWRAAACPLAATYYTYNTSINYTYNGQACQDLGIADHVWQDKRAAIAKPVDDLGDQFRPAMRAGWLASAYIRTAYPDDAAPAAGPPVGQGILVVPD
jgi:hypothetical protein